jgi:hypothetical protein
MMKLPEIIRWWIRCQFFGLCRRKEVLQEIDTLIWENRDRPYIVRMLQDLQTRI